MLAVLLYWFTNIHILLFIIIFRKKMIATDSKINSIRLFQIQFRSKKMIQTKFLLYVHVYNMQCSYIPTFSSSVVCTKFLSIINLHMGILVAVTADFFFHFPLLLVCVTFNTALNFLKSLLCIVHRLAAMAKISHTHVQQ